MIPHTKTRKNVEEAKHEQREVVQNPLKNLNFGRMTLPEKNQLMVRKLIIDK